MIDPPDPGPRIAVIGVTGSGKTTTARRLAQIIGIPHIELDALHWQPNWKMAELEPFREQVRQAVSGPAWVTDGNYSKVRDLIWPRATILVWLDYPLPIILWQLARRSLKRLITQEVLWNSNRETFRGLFLSKDSLFVWALQTHRPYRQEFTRLISQPENSHLQVVRLRDPKRRSDGWPGRKLPSAPEP